MPLALDLRQVMF